MGVSAGELIQEELIVMFYGPILLSLLFYYLRGGALSRIFTVFLVSVSAGGLIQGEFIVMFYGPILLNLLF